MTLETRSPNVKTHTFAYLRNQWSNCFHIWYAYRLWWPNSKYDLLTSVWPSRSKIGRGQKVGQNKIFSKNGLWHTKMTVMKSRMQNCHTCLPNFPCFWDIRYFVFSQCYLIGPDQWKWWSSMSIISIMDPFQWFYRTLIYFVLSNGRLLWDGSIVVNCQFFYVSQFYHIGL